MNTEPGINIYMPSPGANFPRILGKEGHVLFFFFFFFKWLKNNDITTWL